MARVRIKRGSQSRYDTLLEKDVDTLYFCTDTGQYYLGDTPFTPEWEEML